MAADRRLVLFVSPGEAGVQASWTEAPAIAAIAEEYVEDRAFMEESKGSTPQRR